MQRLLPILAGLLLACQWGAVAVGDEFKLANGNVMQGELASADEDGIVVKLDVGGFSKREPWINLSQETLKQLAKDPKIEPLVEPFIELEPEEIKARDKQKKIVVHDVAARMERPTPKPGLIAAFTTPMGLTILAMLMLANLYAAYEIAIFRQQPVALVCGLAVLLPGLVPLIFLSLPAPVYDAPAEGGAEAAAEESPQTKTTTAFAGQGQMPAGGLGLAAVKKAEGTEIPTQVFTRGEFTFNRRFIETKFPGFFRVVPSEAEKDLVLVIKTLRDEMVARRVSRISSNEMHVQLFGGTASKEVSIQFAEIQSIQIRHKDAITKP